MQIKNGITMDADEERDPLYDDAVRVVLETKRGSVSLLQRKLTIGYARASRIIECMEADGLVGGHKGGQAREATLTLDEWEELKNQQNADDEDYDEEVDLDTDLEGAENGEVDVEEASDEPAAVESETREAA